MRRKTVVWLLTAVVLSTIPFAEAQQAAKVARVGYLDSGTSSGGAVLLDAFRQEMGKLGWIEGKNITLEPRFSEGKGPDRLAELAVELIRLEVDVIVGTATAPALAAKRATSSIPIVMVNAGNPVAAGLVASLARPGGNVTGLSGLTPELSAKRLEILKEVVPKLTRVGLLLGERGGGGQELQLKEIRAAAVALEVKLHEIRTNFDLKSLESAFQTAVQKQVKAITSPSTRIIFSARKRIVELAGKYRLPAIYFQKEFIDAGGLMFYGTDFRDQYRRVATYVDKILKGAKPADLPVEQPTKFEFVINLKAAKQIGLTIPQSVLYRADKVIK